MQAPNSRTQRTFSVEGQKIKIVSRRITRQANHAGWSVNINGNKSRYYVLTRREAEDLAYVAWVKSTIPPEHVAD